MARLQLGGDFVSMAEVAAPGGKASLAVVVADHARPKRHRTLLAVQKTADKGGVHLAVTARLPLAADVGAFDVCRLAGPDGPASVLLVRPDGIYVAGQAEPLAKGATLFAHARDDALPRVRICFDLFKGETMPALVVPTLAGVDVFRRHGDAYVLNAALTAEADSHYAWSSMRGLDEDAQDVSLRLDYPDVTAPDFDGDGLRDLCFTKGESFVCKLQGKDGFAYARERRVDIDVLTDAERLDGSVRVDGRLVDLTGKGLPSLLLQKTNWNIANMSTTLFLFQRGKDGAFGGKPAETLTRKGFFAFHELMDLDGDGLPDLIAPVAPLGWSDLARMYLTKSADLDFIWYKNVGGRFAEEPRTFHSLSFPVEFKNVGALLGALPIWDVKLGSRRPKAAGERLVAYFPGKEAIEVVAMRLVGGEAKEELVMRLPADVGSDALAADLDGAGATDLVFAYPREAQKVGQLLLVDLGRAGAP